MSRASCIDIVDAPQERWLSVDPYMRGRMNDAKSYAQPYALNAPMVGGAIGEVVASRAEGFMPGDLVLHSWGWRDQAVGPAAAVDNTARRFSPGRSSVKSSTRLR